MSPKLHELKVNVPHMRRKHLTQEADHTGFNSAHTSFYSNVVPGVEVPNQEGGLGYPFEKIASQ